MYFWNVARNRYVDFDGRASLAQFWYFMLISFVLSFVEGRVQNVCYKVLQVF
jgi:uncharacterized membrane protein YhaH (DUF805 family)